MKATDIVPETQTGQFAVGAKGLGTVTEGMVLRRAKEIAVTNGRKGHEYTQQDYDQAKVELTGFVGDEGPEPDSEVSDAWNEAVGSRGEKTPIRGAGDEQALAEHLVEEGKEEATHHQMLAGNEASRRADQDNS